jgi:L-asparaginase II
VKFDDGAQRAAPVIVAAVLAALTGRSSGADLSALAEISSPPITGGGVPVGNLRALLPDGALPPA